MQGDPACVAFGLHNVQGPLRDIPLAGESIVERSTILANYIADSGTLTANHLAHAITLSCLTSAFTMCKAHYFDTFVRADDPTLCHAHRFDFALPDVRGLLRHSSTSRPLPGRLGS